MSALGNRETRSDGYEGSKLTSLTMENSVLFSPHRALPDPEPGRIMSNLEQIRSDQASGQ